MIRWEQHSQQIAADPAVNVAHDQCAVAELLDEHRVMQGREIPLTPERGQRRHDLIEIPLRGDLRFRRHAQTSSRSCPLLRHQIGSARSIRRLSGPLSLRNDMGSSYVVHHITPFMVCVRLCSVTPWKERCEGLADLIFPAQRGIASGTAQTQAAKQASTQHNRPHNMKAVARPAAGSRPVA